MSEAIKTRRSIRIFRDIPVEEEKLVQILEAARLSPSAKNLQDWKFIVVRDVETIDKIAQECMGQTFVGKAPVIIVGCATEPFGIMGNGQLRHSVDLSIATAFMLLQAQELGLGSCWLGRYDESAVKTILSIPDAVSVVAMLLFGYSGQSPNQRPRKNLEEIICYERYE